MSEFSEGMAVGQAMNRDGGNNCGYPCYPAYPMMGGYGMGFGNGWGGDGWWILLLLLCGWGNNGWGGNAGGGQNLGYELGKLATTNDVAFGFSTSTIMSNQRDLQLAQAQGFADVQQTLCQGFSGLNQTFSNSICNLGYNVQNGFNGVSRQIGDCCCEIKTELLHNRYLNEKQTCDIIQAGNANTQRIIDQMNAKEVQELRDKLQAANLQISQLNQNAFYNASQDAQTAELLRRLGKDCPVNAVVVQPNTPVSFPTNCRGQAQFANNGGCGCCG